MCDCNVNQKLSKNEPVIIIMLNKFKNTKQITKETSGTVLFVSEETSGTVLFVSVVIM